MRIIIADEHPLYREALGLRLAQQFQDAEIEEVGTYAELLKLRVGQDDLFDIVFVDLWTPGGGPGAPIRRIVSLFAPAPVVLMSGHGEQRDIQQAFAFGVRGFFPKAMAADLLEAAVSIIVAGGTYLPADILINDGNSRKISKPAPVLPISMDFALILTPRQQEVIARLALGKSNKEIAADLGVAEVTVKLHVRQIFRKIGARNRAEAALIATRTELHG